MLVDEDVEDDDVASGSAVAGSAKAWKDPTLLPWGVEGGGPLVSTEGEIGGSVVAPCSARHDAPQQA